MERRGHILEADIDLDAGVREEEPGAAITVALCGHWEHDGPCQWPHLTLRSGHAPMRLSIRYAVADDEAAHVRDAITDALRSSDRWRLHGVLPERSLDSDEQAWAERMRE